MTSVSRAIRLFGTEEPVAPMTELRAGPLSCQLDAGNLRYLELAGKEAIRAIAFIVRDRNWGTYNPAITDLVVDQRSDGFTVTYDASCTDQQQSFRYRARIEGRNDGSLEFTGEGEALSDFVTNRTGFVVLHAVEGVSGAPLTVEHVDGRIVQSKFPELVDPTCPFQDIRALTHEVLPGVKVALRMEGDAFEMEDHRNWMDASYKTYVRPLALPWPYRIAKGEKLVQKISLQIEGMIDAAASGAVKAPVTVTIGGPTGKRMPAVGLAVPAEEAKAALANAQLLKGAAPSFLVGHFDARQLHDAGTVQDYDQLARALGAELVLEIVVPCEDAAGKPTDDPAALQRNLQFAKGQVERVGVRPARIVVSPACDLKCTLPGSIWPKAPSWEELFRAARKAFPGVPVGGGMLSYFTELNRKRPPAEVLDIVGHSGCPIVHAGDDTTMTENLEALPWQFLSTRTFCPGKPYWIYPTAIAMRANPYGKVPAENPGNIRQAMNRVDPRERGLIGAAWYAGYLAHAGRAGLDAVALAAVAGPSGIVYHRQAHAQPWADDGGVKVFPSFHVIAEHAGLGGQAVLESSSSAARDVQVLAVSRPERTTVVVCNLRETAQTVALAGLPGGTRQLRLLDEKSMEAACGDPLSFRRTGAPHSGDRLELGSYAVAFLDIAGGAA